MKKTKSINSDKRKNPIVLIIFVFILGIIVLGKIFFSQQQSNISPSNIIPSITVAPTLPLQISSQDEKGYTTVTVYPYTGTSYQTFSFKFPSDWSIETKENEFRFVVSKGEYSLSLSQPAIGGGVCLFSDTAMDDIPEPWQGNPIEKTYKQISFKQGTFRRFIPEYLKNKTDQKEHFEVCEKIPSQGKLYEVPLNGGAIEISVPKNSNPRIINEMDNILASISYIE